MRLKDVGEVKIIESIRQRSRYLNDVVIPIGDDTAAVSWKKGWLQLLTTDLLVEGVHFLREHISMKDLGYKSMAVNLSDIAAMGGIPRYALVSLGLPPDLKTSEIRELYDGMYELADAYGVDIVGGDVTTSPIMVINLALMGEVESHLVLRQDQARAGDLVAVTGELGGSAAGLAALLNPQLNLPPEVRNQVLALHNRPHPRVDQGRLFARSGMVTAAKDISDGLSKEVLTIARSSHQGVVIWANRIPIRAETREVAARLNIDPINLAINGGEDYELLFTFSPANLPQLQSIASQENASFTVVGEIVPEDLGYHIIDSKGNRQPLEAKGYNHFQEV